MTGRSLIENSAAFAADIVAALLVADALGPAVPIAIDINQNIIVQMTVRTPVEMYPYVQPLGAALPIAPFVQGPIPIFCVIYPSNPSP